MNKKIMRRLQAISIPVGAILLNACGATDVKDNHELALNETSDNWIYWDGHISEFGGCYNGWDDNGNGLKDSEDPDCHVYLGPLRDLSLAPYPVGHNFLPDVAKIPYGGPGWGGFFDNREQISRWFRFLTNMNGDIEGLGLFEEGADPLVTPIPVPLPYRPFQGTFAQGNNNNISIGAMHTMFLDHGFLGATVAPGPVPVPAVEVGVVDVAVGVEAAVAPAGSDIPATVSTFETTGYPYQGGVPQGINGAGNYTPQTKDGVTGGQFGNWRGNYRSQNGPQVNQNSGKGTVNRYVGR